MKVCHTEFLHSLKIQLGVELGEDYDLCTAVDRVHHQQHHSINVVERQHGGNRVVGSQPQRRILLAQECHHGLLHGLFLWLRLRKDSGWWAASADVTHKRDSAGSITSSVSSVRATLIAEPRS